ncbi:hypothetical protein [Clostridium sp.]|uniref:hypothetical protein n=1 Tax=Clostridium sp. TaxID=1506 RepID=UPI001D25CED4|nr:hypothetical protein [Clostridium sp.]MBS5937762.1 hypothetical protein [Clostridium sp.]
MDIEESIYIIEGVIKEYMNSRIYMRYCVDNILLQFNGSAMNYIDYKNRISSVNTDKHITTIEEKENIRNNAIKTFSEIFG